MYEVNQIFFRKQKNVWCFWYTDRFEKKKMKSTGCRWKKDAEQFRLEFIADLKRKSESMPLEDWAADFFERGKCPREERLMCEGKSVSLHHQKNQKNWLDNYILKDKLCKLYLHEITRNDLIQFQSRLLSGEHKDKKNTITKVMETLKVIINEAYFREVIDRNPFRGIGKMKYKKKETGIFTLHELNELFFQDPPDPWQNYQAYCCFLIPATLGRRRGEVLALQWKHIDFDNNLIMIHQAWKRGEGYGAPKWGTKLTLPMPAVTKDALKELSEKILEVKPDHFIFSVDGRKAYGETWWKNQFRRGIEAYNEKHKNTKINREARNLKPHSFRHTLNTILRMRMKDPSLVRSFIGWTNERTQEGYTHFQGEHLKQVAGEIDSMFHSK